MFEDAGPPDFVGKETSQKCIQLGEFDPEVMLTWLATHYKTVNRHVNTKSHGGGH